MIDVRRATRDDAATIVSFQIQIARETEDLSLDPDTVHAGVHAVFDHPERGTYWVAEYNGQVVGGLLTVPEWSDWRNRTVLWIHSLYVTPEARGKGVWSCLYTHLKTEVEHNTHLAGLRLYVDKTNHRARDIYGHLGMDNNHYEMFEWMK